MRSWQRIGVSLVFGTAIGLGAAWASVAIGRSGLALYKGAWTTSRSTGSAAADDRTRAIVAWRGLLALPRSEALYYDASVDGAGRPLNGKCRYRVEGGEMPVRWWSITAYDGAGYLLRTTTERPSVGSASLPPITFTAR